MKTQFLALFCALLAVFTGCARKPATAVTQITGIVQYQEPIELESGATLELRLTDVSGEDGAVEVAKATVTDLKSLPYQYALPYDAGKIDTKHRYTVDARISTGNTLRFATDTAHAVLTQGNGATRNITVTTIGDNAPSLVNDTRDRSGTGVFHGELRRDREISLYKAGVQDGHIIWLEEDRSNGTPQALHARYDFKGALIMRYDDSTPMEISFDDRGRPTNIIRHGKPLTPGEQIDAVNAVRNRAELLRSHALAVHEAQSHRQATGG